ncbi:MAG: DUF1592 domain-containing protein [Verrucomicrobiales bacterium]|nr:DUF1592 domain-containing protein [Verrucomicrobiales bacterium]
MKFETGNYERFHPTYQAYLNHPAAATGMPLFNFFRGCSGPQIDLPKKQSGKFIIRARIAVLNTEIPEHRRYVEFGSLSTGAKTGEINVNGFRHITGTMEDPQIIEFEHTPLDQDDYTIMIRERHINQAEAAKRFYIQSFAKTKLGPPPALWIDWVEYEGPIVENWPPESVGKIFPPKEEQQPNWKYYRSVVENFATKAFRGRKPTKPFIDQLMALYSRQLKSGSKPREAIKEPLSIILASPGFLYLNEPVFDQKRRELTDRELAVRLSYFLWSAPPDEELLSIASTGNLKDNATLKKQTVRMLKDLKADEFLSGFSHQWLHMERLDFFQFNYLKYPLFDDSVKESARREVFETIKDAILHARPVGELLNSDYVVVNNLLAEYYGIDGVEGNHFRRIKVPENTPRGGLLGMAAVMAMGSDGERSSPVERGAWILRCLLNDPPPPAPANVPQLSRLDGELFSARELQKAHQEEPQCAQCHRKIDPLGFGLENFDAAGLWREVEVLQLPKSQLKQAKRKGRPGSKKFPVDSSGVMPDGTTFANFFEMRERMAEKEEAFARGFAENLIEYALGRPFGFSDYNLADRVLNRARAKDYAMNEFILGVVQSKPFKMK